jgi:hypothetical protein
MVTVKGFDGLGMLISPVTVRELVPLIVMRLLAVAAANVTVLHAAAVSTVTVAPLAIVTVSAEPGTTPPVQVVFALQLPPVAVLVMAAASTGVAGITVNNKKLNARSPMNARDTNLKCLFMILPLFIQAIALTCLTLICIHTSPLSGLHDFHCFPKYKEHHQLWVLWCGLVVIQMPSFRYKTSSIRLLLEDWYF